MSTLHPQFTARIDGSPDVIFDLIADMLNYGRWLPGSEAFGGTTEASPYPVRLGTTYLDAGPAGQRPGSAPEYYPPKPLALPPTMLFQARPPYRTSDVHNHHHTEPAKPHDC